MLPKVCAEKGVLSVWFPPSAHLDLHITSLPSLHAEFGRYSSILPEGNLGPVAFWAPT